MVSFARAAEAEEGRKTMWTMPGGIAYRLGPRSCSLNCGFPSIGGSRPTHLADLGQPKGG